MTSQSPRIYIYKITFEEVLYYYYGVHKEKKFGEYYMGSPVTHKWVWDFYTPKKQILEIFDYSDESWIEAQEVEKRLIEPVYNTDKWCLNKNCGGIISLEVLRRTGRKTYELGVGIASISKEERQKIGSDVGKENYILNRGVFSLTKEELQEIGRKNYEEKNGFHAWTAEEKSEFSKRNYENGKGLASLTKEQLKENSKRNYENGIGLAAMTTEDRQRIAKINYERKVGIHGRSAEEMSKHGRKWGKISHELGIGIHGRTKEQIIEDAKKGGRIAGAKNYEMKIGIHSQTIEEKIELGRKTSSQRWKCLETGYISTPAGLSNYQRKRGIDTSKRERIS
jgi:hypothetical protein